jgi:hypothetical protein
MAIHPGHVSAPQKGHFTGARPEASSASWGIGMRLRVTRIKMDTANPAAKIKSKIQIIDADIAAP